MTESDWSDQSAGSGTDKCKDKVTWWEAPGGGSRGGGEGKGGEEIRGGGQGKGCNWRKPGTLGFLKNHRNMLTHMATRGALQLEEAESAFQQACHDFEQAPTQNNLTRFRRAADRAIYRSDIVDVVAIKWRRLGENTSTC